MQNGLLLFWETSVLLRLERKKEEAAVILWGGLEGLFRALWFLWFEKRLVLSR